MTVWQVKENLLKCSIIKPARDALNTDFVGYPDILKPDNRLLIPL